MELKKRKGSDSRQYDNVTKVTFKICTLCSPQIRKQGKRKKVDGPY